MPNRHTAPSAEPFDITSAERELIEILREVQSRAIEDRNFQLTIAVEDAAWEIAMSDEKGSARGVGGTFDQAWDRMDPDVGLTDETN